jgi:regulatory protein
VGEILEKAVNDSFAEVDEEKQAREYLRRKRLKKPQDKKQAARIFRQLIRAGFGSKTIFKILRNWDVDDETLSTFEEEISEQ